MRHWGALIRVKLYFYDLTVYIVSNTVSTLFFASGDLTEKTLNHFKKTPKSKIIIEHYWSGLQDFKSDKILFKSHFKPHKSIRDFYQTKIRAPWTWDR